MAPPRRSVARDSSREVKRDVRVSADVPVRFARGDAERAGRCVDLSPGGMFVETTAPPPMGAEIALSVDCGSRGTVHVRAKVSRIGIARRLVRHPKVHHLTLAAHGFGCRLLDPAPAALRDVYEDLLAVDEG